MKKTTAQVSSAILDLIMPRACVTCGGRVGESSGKFICSRCRRILMARKIGRFRTSRRHNLSAVYYLYHYHPYNKLDMGSAIRVLKYQGYPMLGEELAEILAEKIMEIPIFEEADCITAVPLHRVRQRERGYNQSELIARHLAEIISIPYLSLLRRVKNTKSQAELSPEEREYNVKAAFTLEPGDDIAHCTIILLDDQVTTGATIDQAAKPLYYGYADQVLGLSITH